MAGGTAWEQWRLPRVLSVWRPDVLFAPGYTAPLDDAVSDRRDHSRRVVFRPPGVVHRARRAAAANAHRWSARRANLVLTVSEFSRDEIVRYIGISGRKVRVVPHGMTRRTAGSARSAPSREPMILFVGSIFRRRHVDKLLTRVHRCRWPVACRTATWKSSERIDRTRHTISTQIVRESPAAVQSRIALHSYVYRRRRSPICMRAPRCSSSCRSTRDSD